jgi:predicted ATPase/DNA-binding winged helix-turn-helix (wHTH) protein
MNLAISQRGWQLENVPPAFSYPQSSRQPSRRTDAHMWAHPLMNDSNANGQSISFGRFVAIPAQRILLEDGRPVRLGSRAFDILLVLLGRPGEVISKEDLMAAAWPSTFVEEANLRVHIGALRKALGDDRSLERFIENVPGRGYCFVSNVTESAATDRNVAPNPQISFPASSQLVGRELMLQTLATQLSVRRLITIVGPGGIGKTSVAVAAAHSIASSYPDGLAFVDLAPVGDPLLVPGIAAAGLGLSSHYKSSFAEVPDAIRDRRMLVILDNCEHLIDSCAELAERLIQNFPGVRILATSREPLRAKGEWVERLSPLGLPRAADATTTSAEALQFSAVQLFVDRAAACLGGYELIDADATVVVEICRRLDGIALAIELAAGRLDTLGIHGLTKSLADSFLVLTRGRRTALARHQTMRATLDWSYALLSTVEQTVLQRLAVFNGPFSAEAAHAIADDSLLSGEAVEEAIANLIAKSLLAANFVTGEVQYKLLEVTRTYGFDHLKSAGEGARIARRHAEYFRAIFDRADAEWETRSATDWLKDYAGHLDNLRSALDWSFSTEGDASIATALTAAAVPLWFQLSLIDECLSRVERAIALLDLTPGQDTRRRMQLHAALGWPQMRAIAGLPSGAAAWKETLRLAELIGDIDYQQRALWALWVDRTNSGEPLEALRIAEKFAALALVAKEPSDERIGDRMRARSLYLLGDPAGARQHIDRMLNLYVPPAKRSHVARFQYDQRLVARITLARVMWLQGYADEAVREIEDSVREATAIDHALTLAHVLSDAACPVALMLGDLDLADRFTTMLYQQTKTHSLDVWHTYAGGFAGEIQVRRGKLASGLESLRRAIDSLSQSNYILYRTAFQAALSQGLTAAGQTSDALALVDQAIAQCDTTGEAWLLAELYRIGGDIQVRAGDPGAATKGEASLARSLAIARSQKALAWELRTATSLATYWKQNLRLVDASALIAEVLEKFTEGFETPDYRAASTLLSDIGGAAAR